MPIRQRDIEQGNENLNPNTPPTKKQKSKEDLLRQQQKSKEDLLRQQQKSKEDLFLKLKILFTLYSQTEDLTNPVYDQASDSAIVHGLGDVDPSKTPIIPRATKCPKNVSEYFEKQNYEKLLNDLQTYNFQSYNTLCRYFMSNSVKLSELKHLAFEEGQEKIISGHYKTFVHDLKSFHSHNTQIRKNEETIQTLRTEIAECPIDPTKERMIYFVDVLNTENIALKAKVQKIANPTSQKNPQTAQTFLKAKKKLEM